VDYYNPTLFHPYQRRTPVTRLFQSADHLLSSCATALAHISYNFKHWHNSLPTATMPPVVPRKARKIGRALKSAARFPGRGSGRSNFSPSPGELPIVFLRVQVQGCRGLARARNSANSKDSDLNPLVISAHLPHCHLTACRTAWSSYPSSTTDTIHQFSNVLQTQSTQLKMLPLIFPFIFPWLIR
jgi:hypothetical protein